MAVNCFDNITLGEIAYVQVVEDKRIRTSCHTTEGIRQVSANQESLFKSQGENRAGMQYIGIMADGSCLQT